MMYGLGQETGFDWSSLVAPLPPPPAPATPGFDWSSFLAQQAAGWSRTAQNILGQRETPRGVLTQTAPGVFTYVQPEGSSVTLPVSTAGFSASASPGVGIILIGGAAVFLLFMLARKRG